MLEFIISILEGDEGSSLILADYIEDYFPDHKEAEMYCKRLRDPKTLRLQTVIDCGIKFGDKKTRTELSKTVRKCLDKLHFIAWKKPTTRAYCKKSWSLNRKWRFKQELHEVLNARRIRVTKEVQPTS